jgi:hypothetical protein
MVRRIPPKWKKTLLYRRVLSNIPSRLYWHALSLRDVANTRQARLENPDEISSQILFGDCSLRTSPLSDEKTLFVSAGYNFE